MKFGGTSVGSAQHWPTIARAVQERLDSGSSLMLVLSALSGVTDALVQLSAETDQTSRDQLIGAVRTYHVDLVDTLGMNLSTEFETAWQSFLQDVRLDVKNDEQRAGLIAWGECLATTLACQILQSFGLSPIHQNATRMLSVSKDSTNPLSSHCDVQHQPELSARLAGEGALHITQGFAAAGPEGRPWLLGRGGSDTSAACLAVQLGAHSLEIWTDVPGMFSADPRVVSNARLLKQLAYVEAQELASMGAKVLHPPSVRVCKLAGIPVRIFDTGNPEIRGTQIGPRSADTEAQLKGIVSRNDVTLVMMENPSMWRQVGFLAGVFAVFARHGVSIDLISTSESSVTVSLDPDYTEQMESGTLDALISELSDYCEVSVRTGCVSISLVGIAIRTILGRLSESLSVFQDRQVHMVTQSANDLNLTLVVDQLDAERVVRKLHDLLIVPGRVSEQTFGGTWQDLVANVSDIAEPPWWETCRASLLCRAEEAGHAYVYHLQSVRQAAEKLQALQAVDHVLYAVKANDHPEILRTLFQQGVGFDCVSGEELHHVLESVPEATPADILFTPNFAARTEYEMAVELGVRVTIDNLHPLTQWPEVIAGQEIFIRVDLDWGHGHHQKVVTSGKRSKFGIGGGDLVEVARLAKKYKVIISGLHAHTGSGVNEPEVWAEQLRRLAKVRELFPDAKVLDLGGGLGVPEHPTQPGVDLDRVDESLAAAARDLDVDVWIEPGRFLVAQAGVLVSRVTQLKSKGNIHYLGLETGMNSLVRPALYGAYHEVVNLSRLGEPATRHYNVVGPICESGDVLAENRYLPEAQEGDIILIANAGAYGRVMASRYNRRAPAKELII